MRDAQLPRLGSSAILAASCLALTLLFCTLGAWRFAPGTSNAAAAWPGNYLVQGLVHWDSGWYRSIADHGYWYHPGVQSPVAFFPLYPLCIRALIRMGVDGWLGGILLSAVCGLLAVFQFERWARYMAPAVAAHRATLLLVLYPFSFFLFGVMYADSFFLLFAVSAFLSLEGDRPGWAGFFGALATAARPVAPALVLGLLVRRWEQKRALGQPWQLRDAALLLAGAGIAVYCAFLQGRFGDALAFAHVQGAPGWDQPPGAHTWLKVAFFEILASHPAPLVAGRLLTHAAVAAVLLTLIWPTLRRLGLGYGVYLGVLTTMAALGSKDFMGMGRYALAGFPAFLTLALLLKEHPWSERGWLAFSSISFCLLAVAFGAAAYVS